MRRVIALLVLVIALITVRGGFAGEGNGRIGLGLGAEDGAIAVVLVAPGSPAAGAGLKVGMVVDEIDGVKTAGKSLQDCAALVRGQPGTSVILKLTEPGNPKPVVVALERAAPSR